MKKILFIICIIFSFNNLEAKTIDEISAKKVATNFINRQVKNGKTVVLETSYISTKKDVNSAILYTNFYVFNIVDGEGFVIISADDNVEPILGYSFEKDFEIEKIPSQVANWLEDYSTQIGIVIENKISSKLATTKWNNLLSNIIIKEKTLPTAVKPLLKTTWSQDPYYNDQCPLSNNVKTVTGCVATAMAQAMKYWNYPTTGTGSNSYTSKTLGLQSSANFGSTTYNWANMLNNINSANSEIAKLMFHCGVAINMNYGTAASGGSSAYLYGSYPSAEYALKNYFGYPSSLKFVNKTSYSTDVLWLDVLKTELIAARVIIYQGFSSTASNASGHCFVADGFDVNNFIHFNWGWGGSYNGYFSVASLIPSGSGTGGGAGNYTSNQGALIGLTPPTSSAPVADFSASSTITSVGSIITLSDLSTNIPNSWKWTITPSTTISYANGTSDNSKFPEVTFTASGQYTIKLEATNSFGTGSITKTAYIIVNPALASQVCDTLTNFSATDQKVNYTITGGGYMAGHNVSKLKGYAEYYPSNTPYTHISGVILEFAHAEASNSTNTIKVSLYSDVSNKPGVILKSKTVRLIDIVNDVNNNQPTTVLFDTPYQLTGSFYVGYTLTYFAGDTVSVYTGKSGAISTNTSFFQYPTDIWRDYKSGWGENQHLKISPMISTMPIPNFTITSSPALVNTNVIIDASLSEGAYAFNWTIANANITSSKFYKETISYSTSGTHDIILDVTGGCGTTKQITKQIVINDNCITAPVSPGTISGITSICPGSTNVTYTVGAVSDASSYKWTLPTGITGTSTTNSIMVNISNTIQNGSIKVSAENSCGTSAEASLSFTPVSKTTTNFNSVNAVCSGTVIPSLPTQSLEGINGQWAPTLNNSTTTPYTFTPTLGQCATTATLTITINPLPTVTATVSSATIYEGKSVTLTGSGAQSYTWNNGVTNAIAFKPLVGAITYTVTGTAANNCTNTANVLVTVLSSAGIENLNLNDLFNAYINSSTDELIINATFDKTSNIILTLINSEGQEIYNQKYSSFSGEFNSNINVNNFKTGV